MIHKEDPGNGRPRCARRWKQALGFGVVLLILGAFMIAPGIESVYVRLLADGQTISVLSPTGHFGLKLRFAFAVGLLISVPFFAVALSFREPTRFRYSPRLAWFSAAGVGVHATLVSHYAWAARASHEFVDAHLRMPTTVTLESLPLLRLFFIPALMLIVLALAMRSRPAPRANA